MRSFFILNYMLYPLNNERIVKLKKCFKKEKRRTNLYLNNSQGNSNLSIQRPFQILNQIIAIFNTNTQTD